MLESSNRRSCNHCRSVEPVIHHDSVSSRKGSYLVVSSHIIQLKKISFDSYLRKGATFMFVGERECTHTLKCPGVPSWCDTDAGGGKCRPEYGAPKALSNGKRNKEKTVTFGGTRRTAIAR